MTILYFYPTYIGTFTKNYQTHFQIFGKLETGERIHIIDNEYFVNFYVKLSESIEEPISFLNKFSDAQNNKLVVGVLKVYRSYHSEDSVFYKVSCNTISAMNHIVDSLREQENVLLLAEDDIDHISKYMVERSISLFSLHKFEGTQRTYRSRCSYVFDYKTIEPESNEVLQGITVASIGFNNAIADIDDDSIPINTFTIRTKNFARTITRTKIIAENVEFVNSEYELIVRFKELIEGIKPDFLIGEKINDFIFNLKARAVKYKASFDIGYDHSNISGMHEPKINGVQIIDFYNINNESMRTGDFNANFDNDVVKCKTVSKYYLERFNDVLDYILEASKLFLATPSTILRSDDFRLVDLYLYKEYYDAKSVIPAYMNFGESFKYVFESKPGLYERCVAVNVKNIFFDVLVDNNVSIDSSRCKCCEGFCNKQNSKIKQILLDLDARIYRLKDMSVDDTIDLRLKVLERVKHEMASYVYSSSNRFFNKSCLDFLGDEVNSRLDILVSSMRTEGYNMLAYHDFRIFFEIKDVLIKNFRDALLKCERSAFLELTFKNILISKEGYIAAKSKSLIFSTFNYGASRISKEVVLNYLDFLFENDLLTANKYLRYVISKIVNSKIDMSDLVLSYKLLLLKQNVNPLYKQIVDLYKKDRHLFDLDDLKIIISNNGDYFLDRISTLDMAKNYSVDFYVNEIKDFFILILDIFDLEFDDVLNQTNQSDINDFE